MKTKGLKADFFTFYNAISGIVIEIFAAVVIIAIGFVIGAFILQWFRR